MRVITEKSARKMAMWIIRLIFGYIHYCICFNKWNMVSRPLTPPIPYSESPSVHRERENWGHVKIAAWHKLVWKCSVPHVTSCWNTNWVDLFFMYAPNKDGLAQSLHKIPNKRLAFSLKFYELDLEVQRLGLFSGIHIIGKHNVNMKLRDIIPVTQKLNIFSI